MGPYGTIQPGVNGTRCNNQYQQMELSNNTFLWDIHHLANGTNKRCNIQFTVNHPDSIHHNNATSEMHSYNITVITHSYA